MRWMIQGTHAACEVSTLYQAQEALEILPAIAAIPEHSTTEYMSHNDQEYDTIYYLQGGDMWHIVAASYGTGLYGLYSVTASLPLKC
ncbi:MAG: hypothetical protein IPL55_21470 [Saprospiraceae bacterium]|nr:hypothetical protein [Saprospiraceae bacterium]